MAADSHKHEFDASVLLGSIELGTEKSMKGNDNANLDVR